MLTLHAKSRRYICIHDDDSRCEAVCLLSLSGSTILWRAFHVAERTTARSPSLVVYSARAINDRARGAKEFSKIRDVRAKSLFYRQIYR